MNTMNIYLESANNLSIFSTLAHAMGRILAIDYGRKRCGIAVTDEARIIASPLDTVQTHLLPEFLQKYFNENEVEYIIEETKINPEIGDKLFQFSSPEGVETVDLRF